MRPNLITATAVALVTLLRVGALAQTPAAVPARDNAAQKGSAIIRGRVTAADSGQPLRKAQVRIVSPDVRENRVTMTDPQGAYEFKDLPATRYGIYVAKGGYVGLAFGQKR